MSQWNNRILDELVYERVRLSLELAELVAFERDLGASIERSLAGCASSREEQSRLARKCLARAWRRIEREWAEEIALERALDRAAPPQPRPPAGRISGRRAGWSEGLSS